MRKKLDYNVVIPAKAGIQNASNYLKRLDSRFHGNDAFAYSIAVFRLYKSFST